MMNIVNLLENHAVSGGGRPAIMAPGRSALDYDGLLAQVMRCGQVLRTAGVESTSRVAVVLANGPEMAATAVGVMACAACVPLSPDYSEPELRFYLEDARADAVVVRRGERGPIRGVADALGLRTIELDAGSRAGELVFVGQAGAGGGRPVFSGSADVALVLHTSGTTARPKIVPLTQANLVASARNIALHLRLAPADRCLNVMPLFHIHGLVGALLASIAGGGSIVCTPGFDDEAFFEWIAQFDPTWYTAVPTIHQAVVAHDGLYRRKAPGHRFRFVRSSSSALSPRTFEALASLFDCPVVEAYGMTEASHQMTSNPLPPGATRVGSVGLAAGAEVSILDDAGRELGARAVGEICVLGSGMTAGYERNDDANARSFVRGWFRTGDQGWLDDEGYLYISGRLKEIINRGGEKVSPREVDEALLEHPDVAQAAAFPVPHATLGEDVVAAVVRRRDARVDEPALRAFLFSRLAPYKVPTTLVFVEAIPKGSTGKVQRSKLHERLAGLIPRAFVEPRPGLERTLEGFFRDVLGCGPIGAHDNFFVLGGDSLQGTRLIARVNREFGLELEPACAFLYPSISELAGHLRVRSAEIAVAEATLDREVEAMSDDEVMRALAEDGAADAARSPWLQADAGGAR